MERLKLTCPCGATVEQEASSYVTLRAMHEDWDKQHQPCLQASVTLDGVEQTVAQITERLSAFMTGLATKQSESSTAPPSVLQVNLTGTLESCLRAAISAYFKFRQLPEPVLDFQQNRSTGRVTMSWPLIESTFGTGEDSGDNGRARNRAGDDRHLALR